MIGLVFAGITLGAALMATFVRHIRRAILALWVAGLGVGAMYLTAGAEFLAILQWIVSTLVALSFVFFSVMFGEYNAPSSKAPSNQFLMIGLSVALGVGFAIVIWLGAGQMPESTLQMVEQGNDLAWVGRSLTHDNLLSLEVLALLLFLVLVGGGVIARSEGGESK